LYNRPSLLSLVTDESFESCLDMGCGPGEYIPELKKQTQNITAIDLYEEFIDMVNSKHPDVKSYVCDVSKGANEAEGSFDLVISSLAIHYIENFDFLFSEVRRILKKDGIFVFLTDHPVMDIHYNKPPNYFQKEKVIQSWVVLGDTKTEVYFFRRPLTETFNSLFKNGFVIEGFNEGVPSEKIKENSEKLYEKLTIFPQFIFVRARKNSAFTLSFSFDSILLKYQFDFHLDHRDMFLE